MVLIGSSRSSSGSAAARRRRLSLHFLSLNRAAMRIAARTEATLVSVDYVRLLALGLLVVLLLLLLLMQAGLSSEAEVETEVVLDERSRGLVVGG